MKVRIYLKATLALILEIHRLNLALIFSSRGAGHSATRGSRRFCSDETAAGAQVQNDTIRLRTQIAETGCEVDSTLITTVFRD